MTNRGLGRSRGVLAVGVVVLLVGVIALLGGFKRSDHPVPTFDTGERVELGKYEFVIHDARLVDRDEDDEPFEDHRYRLIVDLTITNTSDETTSISRDLIGVQEADGTRLGNESDVNDLQPGLTRRLEIPVLADENPAKGGRADLWLGEQVFAWTNKLTSGPEWSVPTWAAMVTDVPVKDERRQAMRRLVWIATALVLAGALVVVPHLDPVQGEDPFPATVGLHERTKVNGGAVTFDKVTVAPVWTDGDEKLSLKKQGGVFVQVRATAPPGPQGAVVARLDPRRRPDLRGERPRRQDHPRRAARVRHPGRDHLRGARRGPRARLRVAGLRRRQLRAPEARLEVGVPRQRVGGGGRVKRLLPIVLSLLAVACALGIVRSELAEGASVVEQARPVPAHARADLTVSKPTSSKKVTGSYRLESVNVFPQLVPGDEWSDPIGRPGGRVVVAVFDCTCPLGDDFLKPTAYAVDAADRRWESDHIDPKDYPEVVRLGKFESDLGEKASYRFVEVFVVPSQVASSVDILMDPITGKPRLFRR